MKNIYKRFDLHKKKGDLHTYIRIYRKGGKEKKNYWKTSMGHDFNKKYKSYLIFQLLEWPCCKFEIAST